MFCNKCGVALNGSALLCSNCGHPVFGTSDEAHRTSKPTYQDWVEIWVEDRPDPYLLMVRADDSDPPNYVVLDPIDNYKIAFTSKDYQQVRYYLFEDEFMQVEGRTELI